LRRELEAATREAAGLRREVGELKAKVDEAGDGDDMAAYYKKRAAAERRSAGAEPRGDGDGDGDGAREGSAAMGKEPLEPLGEDELRTAATAAMAGMGLVYDEASGLYYDWAHGYYYDPQTEVLYRYVRVGRVRALHSMGHGSWVAGGKRWRRAWACCAQLYYAPSYNAYYTRDAATGEYAFHSYRADAGAGAGAECMRLVVGEGSGCLAAGGVHVVGREGGSFGRDKTLGHVLRIPDIEVSKAHAAVAYHADMRAFVLTDQGSRNGTFVNGERLAPMCVACGQWQ
jgi:hypothetical protein